MKEQTFIDQMKARGYETTPPSPSGNVTATKGDITVRLVPLADYIVYIKTSTTTAIILIARRTTKHYGWSTN